MAKMTKTEMARMKKQEENLKTIADARDSVKQFEDVVWYWMRVSTTLDDPEVQQRLKEATKAVEVLRASVTDWLIGH